MSTNYFDKYFHEAYSAFDKIALKVISDIAYRQASSHVSKPKEYAFWKAVYSRCKINVK